MAQQAHAIGIDFGTSNSAAGWLRDGRPRLITLDEGKPTMPSTFFFDYDARRVLLGEAANRALLSGSEGRFMRALKRVLGTSLMHEKRQLLNERVTFFDIIARFLTHIRETAEAETGLRFNRVLAGRPVVFHGAGDPREAQAEADLRACYHAAGFCEVAFMPEPEAAAIASGGTTETGRIGLIVDVGGGTSDFSVFEAQQGRAKILANHGVRIGGTDFDRAISLDHVMPLLGKGSELRKLLGQGTTPTPNAIYNDLATWEKIPFVATPQNRRMVAEMERLALEPARLARLGRAVGDELGHDIAFAVERGKIAANEGGEDAAILLAMLDQGLNAPLCPDLMAATLAPLGDMLAEGAADTLAQAGLAPEQIGQVVYVGGSSLMGLVPARMRAIFPDARHDVSEVFTAVTDGLALASG